MEKRELDVVQEDEGFLIVDYQKEDTESSEHVALSSTVKDEEKNLQTKAVEIERKFLIPDDCEDRLLKLGCHFNEQKEFTDHYYDTEDYQLTLADRWLRNRSGTWQMKYSVPELPHDYTARYCETETESEILSLLSKFTSRTADSVQDFVRSNCHPLAVLRTLRKSYSYGNVTVVLDNTDCGFKIGEIEAVVREGESFAEGLQAVDDLASKLGFTSFAAYDIASLMPDRSA